MRLISTSGTAEPEGIVDAIRQGQASDGGLFWPDELPGDIFVDASRSESLPATALRFLAPFFAASGLACGLQSLCAETFSFDMLLLRPDARHPRLTILETFHGPTGAFKDVGARFLMRCLDRLGDADNPYTVRAATSGDTGGAVGCAAEGRNAVRAVILFPKGRVSAFQRHQLTCWQAPVTALEVDGDFDACQALVKAAFCDPGLRQRYHLTSANSINLARLLPQGAYLAWAARRLWNESGETPGLIVPTGNLGHGVAALLARALGAPIGPIVLATNANATLADWATRGVFAPRASVATLANAMDVGAPSNFARLMALPSQARQLRVERVEDDDIRARIRDVYQHTGYVACPHTATALEAFARLDEGVRLERPWIAVATAHPYKFADALLPLISAPIAPSPALAAVESRTSHARTIEPTLPALAAALSQHTETA